MRTVSITLALVASLALMLFSSCTITVKENKSTKLSGEIVKTTRSCDHFDRISIGGGMDVTYIVDDSCYVEIEADKALDAKVSTEVTDGILNIALLQVSFDGNILENDDKPKDDRTFTFHGIKDAIDTAFDYDIKVTVHAPYLNEIHSSGAIDFEAHKVKSQGEFSLRASGKSDIEIKRLESRKVEFSTSGLSDIEVGIYNADTVDIQSSGKSDLDIYFRNCGTAHIQASGACDAELKGSVRNLTKDLSGRADIDDSSLRISQAKAKNGKANINH